MRDGLAKLQFLGPQFPESGRLSRRGNVSLFIQFPKAAITVFSRSHHWTKLKAISGAGGDSYDQTMFCSVCLCGLPSQIYT